MTMIEVSILSIFLLITTTSLVSYLLGWVLGSIAQNIKDTENGRNKNND